jgi:hypothetical protein
MMSIATRLKAPLAVIAMSAASSADAGQTMAASEIEEAFTGITLDGVY